MVTVTFLNAHFLWVLFAIPVMVALHFFLIKYARRRAVLFANFEALRRVTGSMVLSKNLSILLMRLAIILSLTLSASGMIIWYTGSAPSLNYVIALDSSSSMLADDFDPDRLTVAKQTAAEFIDSLASDTKVGLVSFSGASKIEHDLTSYPTGVLNAVNDLRISETGGTDMSGAIITSVNLLKQDLDMPGAVILLTDGQHTAGGPLDEGITYANKNSILVHTIGMATEKGGAFETTMLLSMIDEESLKKIAANTGGRFFRAEDEFALKNAFGEITSEVERNLPLELRLFLLIFGVFLIFAEWVLVNTRFRALP